MRGILIDPIKQEITEVDVPHERDGYKAIYPLIQCELFDAVRVDDENDCFVDDEGLLKDPTHFFRWEGFGQWFAGYGLVLGFNADGETIETTLTVDYVRDCVTFGRLETNG